MSLFILFLVGAEVFIVIDVVDVAIVVFVVRVADFIFIAVGNIAFVAVLHFDFVVSVAISWSLSSFTTSNIEKRVSELSIHLSPLRCGIW